ncbi:GNAT family N-acetyltransferase [Agromyces sp. SYSU K20354]|uniref:GNAT family N-acetyltransferase n=1 Tax=Agromyces cavernae TaxID=2898659 RepID=UPI001E294EA2|nr:GNAT family N-acetyltransferase [Agromyces cavernae]MCD2441114.1 GNAT family N-acetyltransferase [Agromyces cavernae]
MAAETASITLAPKTDAQLERWLVESMAEYEKARVAAGDTPEQAIAARKESEARFFPGGRPTAGQLIFTVLVDGDDAGWLWIGPWKDTDGDGGDGDPWWVWDIRVHDAFQRRGIGRATMIEAERIAREHGAASLGLNVFAYNVPAIRLYESLGYLTTSLHMFKDV